MFHVRNTPQNKGRYEELYTNCLNPKPWTSNPKPTTKEAGIFLSHDALVVPGIDRLFGTMEAEVTVEYPLLGKGLEFGLNACCPRSNHNKETLAILRIHKMVVEFYTFYKAYMGIAQN